MKRFHGSQAPIVPVAMKITPSIISKFYMLFMPVKIGLITIADG